MAIPLSSVTTSLGLTVALLAAAPVAQAFNFGDMFNPGRWMGGGGDDDYYYDEYGGPWGGPYGGYGPYGGGPYGGGPWGGGPYGAPGYGGYGYGAPYGYGPGVGPGGMPGGMPGYAAPGAPPAQPQSSSGSDTKDQEIERLKRRIEQLETRQSPPAQRPSDGGGEGWPSAPAFRPMDQY